MIYVFLNSVSNGKETFSADLYGDSLNAAKIPLMLLTNTDLTINV